MAINMDGKTWTVVKFIVENSVEAVPSLWIHNDLCYWPPYTKDRLKTAIHMYETPDTKTWKLHKIGFFRNGNYDSYNDARKKATKAIETSDLESDYGIALSKRKRKEKVLSSDDGESEEYGDSDLPAPPQASRNLFSNSVEKRDAKKTKVPIEDGNGDEDSHSPLPIHPDFASTPSTSRTIKGITDFPSTPSTSRTVKNITANSDSATTNTKTCNCCAVHKENEYLKQIIRKQSIMQAMMSQLIEDVRGLKNTAITNVDDNTNSIFTIFELPFNNDEQLADLENYLLQENNFTLVVNEISKFGGSNVYDFVRRVIAKFVTNKLAAEYSWLGAKKKKVFGKLKLGELLIQSALKNVSTKNATTKEVEEAIKNWLRRAKERHESNLKKKNSI